MKVITTVVGSLQTNCYLLIDEETKLAALIDPGDEAEKLLALVKSEGVTLKYILLTHGHRDHTLAVPVLKKALPDVPVYIGEADAHSTGIYHYPMADLIPDLKYYGEGGVRADKSIIDEKEFLEKLPEVAKNAIADACTGSNPRIPTQEEMEKLLKACYYDTEVDF